MLKSKKSLYILIPAVAFIWGTVIYKVVTGLDPELPAAVAVSDVRFRESELPKSTLLPLNIPERDPFLGTLTKTASDNLPDGETIASDYDGYDTSSTYYQEPAPETPVPEIIYKGYVKTVNNKKRAVALSINGASQVFQLGQTKNDITLLSATDTRITIRFNDKNITISKL